MACRSIPLVLTAVALVACARTDDQAAARADSAGDTIQVSAGTAPAATSGAAPRVVTVVATDFAFEAPAELPAGLTTFEMTNRGKQLHHVQLVRLDSGKTAQEYVRALKPNGPPPRWSVVVGGPNAANPDGGTSNATVNLEPGNYAVVCFVDLPDRVPHFAKGMVRDLKVTPATGPAAAAPTADVTLTLTDYDFGLPATIAPGRYTIRVTNSAQQPHEIQLARLAPGKTAQDFMAWLEKMQGPPPGDAIGGVDALANGREAYFTADFTPGNYVAICFLPDAKDGKPHFVHGMIKEFRIGTASAN
jgi:hypothetical protein